MTTITKSEARKIMAELEWWSVKFLASMVTVSHSPSPPIRQR
jgi:hypothetical protein